MALTARLQPWYPTPQEVERMVAELRPLLAELARRDTPRRQTPTARY